LRSTGLAYELIVVPNASTDETTTIARRVAESDDHLRIVENPSGGWGRSVLTGLRAAQGAILCYANSARTDPADLERLLAHYLGHAPCLAKVTRVQRGAAVRGAASWLYNAEGRLLFGVRAADVNGTPKIFSRQLFDRLQLSSADDLLDLELLAKANWLCVPVVEMVVSGFKRHGGRSTTTMGSALRMYAGALRLRWRVRAFASP
jgi:glycosyltransferase involved in cell wall biosynthesis